MYWSKCFQLQPWGMKIGIYGMATDQTDNTDQAAALHICGLIYDRLKSF